VGKFGKVIAKNLAHILAETGLNQTQYGERSGLGAPVVNRALRGGLSNPKLETLEALSSPFGKDAIWLLTDHEHAPTLSSLKEGLSVTERHINAFKSRVEALMERDGALTPQEQELVTLFRALKDDARRESVIGSLRMQTGMAAGQASAGENKKRG
jgi:transcriptional regulator with XRE-family HTH domain